MQFRYAAGCDLALILIGTTVALISGISMPGVMIIFGRVIDEMIDYTPKDQNVTSTLNTTAMPSSNFTSNST